MAPLSIAGSMPDITNQSPPPPTLKLGWDLGILFNTVPCVFTTNWIWAVQNETYFPSWDISSSQHEVGTQKIFIRWTEKTFFLVPTTSHAKSWLIGKDPDAGRDWGQEEKGTTQDEMVGWHHQRDGREFEWTLGVGDGQGGLACCDSWGRKESDTTERLNWTEKHYRNKTSFKTIRWYVTILLKLLTTKNTILFTHICKYNKNATTTKKPTHENNAYFLWGSCHHGEGWRKHGRAEGFHLKASFLKKHPALKWQNTNSFNWGDRYTEVHSHFLYFSEHLHLFKIKLWKNCILL